MATVASKDEKGKEKPTVEPRAIKTTTDLQRLRLEKLMKNPDKPVIIPDRPKAKQMPSAPDFVRNVMGSSAGAGSGEFHVYRHLRRKEYSRQKFIQEKSEQEKLDEEYHRKLEENQRKAEARTAKKRAKRLKKRKNDKLKLKNKKKDISDEEQSHSNNSSEESNNEDDLILNRDQRNSNEVAGNHKDKILNKIIEEAQHDQLNLDVINDKSSPKRNSRDS